MKKKNFLLLSLEDDKAKKIANAINNTSCKKILDFLAENEATETQISEKLKMPISSVHYNLKQLLEAKLIDWEKYHYSEKGKEVRHYTVANKYIVIAPKEETEGIREKLKSILPTSLLILLGATFVHLFTKPYQFASNSIQEAAPLMAKTTYDTADDTMLRAEAVNIATTQQPLIQTLLESSAFWFIIGALFTLLTIFIIKKLRKK